MDVEFEGVNKIKEGKRSTNTIFIYALECVFLLAFQIIGGLYEYNRRSKTEESKLLTEAHKNMETKWLEPASIL